LWAAWLWGRAAADPVRAALRRRRYDWSWHAAALRASLLSLSSGLPEGLPMLGYVCEAEPGFVAAALAGMDVAGFALRGRALRVDEGVAILLWQQARPPTVSQPPTGWEEALAGAAQAALIARGEPAPYFVLHAAAWSDLAYRRWLAPVYREAEEHPMGRVVEALETALSDARRFVRLDPRADIETGVYWGAASLRPEPPLSDRVELAVLSLLREKGSLTERSAQEAACGAFPGLLTPDRSLVRMCLQSYAAPDSGEWRLREEDRVESRRADRKEILTLLQALGGRLGFSVIVEEAVRWLQADGGQAFEFHILETAAVSSVVETHSPAWRVVVIPGGRGALVAEKLRRDPRLPARFGQGVMVVKYRHIRRLAEETTLKPEHLAERLALDPPEHQDPQLPLL
jgi:hypothetical protein